MATTPLPPVNNPSSNGTVLYNFTTGDNQGTYGSPRLIPKTQSGNNGANTGQSYLVDVVNKFPWTTLPVGTRVNVPFIQLTEYRLTSSTIIQSLLQQARSTVDAINNTPGNFISGIRNALNINGTGQLPDSTLNSYLGSTVGNAVGTWLDPYQHLYPVTPTGWLYSFPYFENLNQSVTNQWSEKGSSDVNGAIDQVMKTGVGEAVNAIERLASTTKLANITQPGSYTETIKNFTPSQGSVYNVKFTLFNTLNFSDIQRNWEFIFLLTYQNLPNRRSVSLLDPPVIYSATIQGVHQSLYAYISKLTVDNIGAKRYVDLPIGRKLIPEAYNITIELTDLLTNTQNLHLYAHTNSLINATVKGQ
jgi:hypothetical protein